MSEKKNLPEVIEPTTDMTEKDLDRIQGFEELGRPGYDSLSEIDLAKFMELYLSGKTYRQISEITRKNKGLVLFLAKRHDWFALKKEYFNELEFTMRNRVMDAKLASQDFLLQLTQAWQKKIGSKINRYLDTNDETFMMQIDMKEIDKYLKTVEILNKLTEERNSSGGKASPIGLNLGDEGVTVSKNLEGGIEITPKKKAVGELLRQYADIRRQEENAKIAMKSDISKENKPKE